MPPILLLRLKSGVFSFKIIPMKKRELKKWCPEAVNTLNGGAAQNTGHEVSDKQKARMTANLTKSFALLETVLELRLAYLKK